jgi:hypothetical protein
VSRGYKKLQRDISMHRLPRSTSRGNFGTVQTRGQYEVATKCGTELGQCVVAPGSARGKTVRFGRFYFRLVFRHGCRQRVGRRVAQLSARGV